MCLLAISVSSLGKNAYSGLLPTFKSGSLAFLTVLSCMSYLSMLAINLLLVISLANIFSHSVDCLFVLFYDLS